MNRRPALQGFRIDAGSSDAESSVTSGPLAIRAAPSFSTLRQLQLPQFPCLADASCPHSGISAPSKLDHGFTGAQHHYAAFGKDGRGEG